MGTCEQGDEHLAEGRGKNNNEIKIYFTALRGNRV